MYSHTHKRGSALIIALVVLTLLTMMSTVFFEKILRFSQRSEGIENSNVAYYKALGIVEEVLFTGGVNKYTPWNIKDMTYGSTTVTGASLVALTGGTSIPTSGKGNSPYNKDYNIIGLGDPVQIVLPDDITWNTIDFEFQVPIIGGVTSTGILTPGASSSGFILWTFASSGASLFASGETNIFKGADINIGNVDISIYNGTTNSGSLSTFTNFYTDATYLGPTGTDCAGFRCTLKLSLIRPVPLADGRNMTFLEYRISGFITPIPSQYMDIHAEGYAHGFLRSRDIQFPQITTNTALDFAVLQ